MDTMFEYMLYLFTFIILFTELFELGDPEEIKGDNYEIAE